jgi:MFS family permease
MTSVALQIPKSKGMTSKERKVILASSLGTAFEWYDFYLYGSLAIIIGRHFFSSLNVTAGFIFALLAFAAGFAIRPFGALFFGRLGDVVGRKYTFLVTMIVMGASTFLVGLLPTYETRGVAAPIALISLRLLQGLALGGEYGGAATYVAEHAPSTRRAGYTAWIQTTATLGLLLSLLVVLGTRLAIGETAFFDWGWRVPFLFSIFLLAISVWIRLSLEESPIFQKIKSEGRTSKAPLSEAFAQWRNIQLVLVSLFGLVAGQAVVWYAGQFYPLFFLTQTLKVDPILANVLVAVSLVITAPFVLLFGRISDLVGRKPVIMSGFLIAALTYFPLFHALTRYANPALDAAHVRAPITVFADPASCSLQFNPVGTSQFVGSCDIAKSYLARAGVSYRNEASPAGSVAAVRIATRRIESFDAAGLPTGEAERRSDQFAMALGEALRDAGYPSAADPAEINYGAVTLVLSALAALVGMVYGPIAAALVELFPTRIRYTGISLPYHIGNGWFGGFLPATAFALVAANGNIYAGLTYPVAIAAISFVIGVLFVPETRNRSLED